MNNLIGLIDHNSQKSDTYGGTIPLFLKSRLPALSFSLDTAQYVPPARGKLVFQTSLRTHVMFNKAAGNFVQQPEDPIVSHKRALPLVLIRDSCHYCTLDVVARTREEG